MLKNVSLKIIALFICFNFLQIYSFSMAKDFKVLPPVLDAEGNEPQKIKDSDITIINPLKEKQKRETKKSKEIVDNTVKDTNIVKSDKPDTLRGEISFIPAKTTFEVIFDYPVSSNANDVGEIFKARLAESIIVNNKIMIPNGTQVVGQITYLERENTLAKNARMEVRFIYFETPDGKKIPINGKIVTTDGTSILKGGDTLKQQLVKIVKQETTISATGGIAGLTAGHLLGHSGSSLMTSTFVGSAIGGAIGLGLFFKKKGKPVKIPENTRVVVEFKYPVDLKK